MKSIFQLGFLACLMTCGGIGVTHAQATNGDGTAPNVVCHTVKVQDPPKDNHQIAGTAVGAVAGGLLGHTIGAGKGNVLATAGGAVAGGYAGKKVQENNQENHPTYHYEKQCHQAQG
jgi:uncharacterized protein YcfJ